MGTSTEEGVTSVVQETIYTLVSTLNARWTSQLTRCHIKNCLQRALDGWRIEMLEVHALDRKLAGKKRYFNNYVARPVFQKWCHEMITTFIVRQKVESADKKRETEILTDVFSNWNHAAKSKYLRYQKGIRVHDRFSTDTLCVAFVHWSHLTYWSASVRRAASARARRRIVACLQAWSGNARKQKGRFSKLAQRDALRRRCIRSKCLREWEYHTSKMRLRNKNRVAGERLHRRLRLSSIFEPWSTHTARNMRTMLENGQGKAQLLVHVCPPKRRILAHFLDLWTLGVTYQRKKKPTR